MNPSDHDRSYDVSSGLENQETTPNLISCLGSGRSDSIIFFVFWGHFGNNRQKMEIFGKCIGAIAMAISSTEIAQNFGLAKLPGIHAMFHHFSTVFVFDTCPGITRILDLSGLATAVCGIIFDSQSASLKS